MNRRVMRTLVAVMMVVMMLLSSTAMAEGEGSRGIAYRVTGGKNEMVILGSIHVGSEEMYPLSDEMTKIIKDAGTLVFECDTESAEAFKLILQMMMLPEGEKLEAHISEETYSLLEQALETQGVPVQAYSMFRPWAISSTLSLAITAMEMGVADVNKAIELGVESQLKEMTKEAGKETAYLETAELQLEMMSGFSPELQDYMLQTTCEELLSDPDEVTSNSDLKYWPSWWYEGNAENFANSYLVSLEEDPQIELMQEYHDALVTERNTGMAERIRELLELDEEHNYLVTVGLLHLVLPGDSVIDDLRDMGYTVERIG